ncbi:hypothetical protein EYZ11_009410 [Aspergillus tanneri]|nr:hypothetical protein EYZ11_009410 [Aspergillus tanneri]
MPTPSTTPIQTIQTWEIDRTLSGMRIVWANGQHAEVGLCVDGPTKQFEFGRQERIQIMYVYVGEQVDGFWFVTSHQKSFFPGKSSTRYEMVELGNGVLVGFEARVKLDQQGREVVLEALGANFRKGN